MTRPLFLSLHGQPSLPTFISFTGIGVDVSAAAGTVIGTLTTTGGLPGYTYTTDNNKFQIVGNQVQRSSTGTLTNGTPESLNFTSTDAVGHSTNTATNEQGPYSLAVTASGVPTGVISNPPNISIPATTPGFSLLATLAAQGGTGVNPVYSVTGNSNLLIDGSGLYLVLHPTLVAGVNETYSLHYTDTGGTYDDASPRTLTIQNTAAPTGIKLTNVGAFPNVLANATAGTILANLAEIGGTGSGVSFSLVAGSDANLAISGSNLVVHSSPSFTPGTSPTFALSVTDSGGTFSDQPGARSYTVPGRPTSLTIGTETIVDNATAGTTAWTGTIAGGTPPYGASDLDTNAKFTLQVSGSGVVCQRSSSGTLTSGSPEVQSIQITDAAGLTLASPQATSITVSAHGSSIQLTSLTVKNVSGGTVSTDFFLPFFGLPLIPGQIAAGGAPIFKLGDGTVCPFSMVKKPLNSIDGNSLWWAGYLVRIPMSGQSAITNNSSITIQVWSGGTVPTGSGFVRNTIYQTGGFDLNTQMVGLGGDMNLTGTWTSDLPTALAANNADDYLYADGDAGRVDRVRSPAMQSGSAHGYLETWFYLMATKDGSGGLGGVRWLNRPTTAYTDINIGPGGANKNVLAFQTWKTYNGASQIVDHWGSRGDPQSFSIAAPGNTFTCTGNTFDTGFLIRMSGGSLPTAITGGITGGVIQTTPITPTTSFWVQGWFAAGAQRDTIQIYQDPEHAASAAGNSATTSGSGTMQAYPYITPYASLFGATSTARYQYSQAGGSMATDPAFFITYDSLYLEKTGLIPPYDLSLQNVQPYSPATYLFYNPTVFSPMSSGPVYQNIPDTGDRADIGPIPLYHANYLWTKNQQDEQYIRQSGLIGGRFSRNLRSNVTKTLMVPNNGTNRAGALYAGMPAPQPTLTYDGSGYLSNIPTPSLLPTNQQCILTGWGGQAWHHMPNLQWMPMILFGEPQYKDMLGETGVMSVIQAEIHDDPEYNSATRFRVGRRNFDFTAYPAPGNIQYYGANAFEAGQRNAAWSSRDVMQASLFDYDDNPSLKSLLQDMNNENGLVTSKVIDTINSYNSFMSTNGPYWETPAPAAYIDQWQDNYYMMKLAFEYQLTGSANALKALTASTKFWDYVTQNYTAYNACINRMNIRTSFNHFYTGTGLDAGLITDSIVNDTSQITFNDGGTVTGWNSGSANINIISWGQNPWVPTVNDVFMFWNFGDSDISGFTPMPLAFKSVTDQYASVPYYMVSVVNTGNLNYTIQLSATLGGSAIVNTDSFTCSFTGHITGNTLTLESLQSGTMRLNFAYNPFNISGSGVTAGTTVNSLLTGTLGVAGSTYRVSASQTVAAGTSITGTISPIKYFFRSSNPSATGTLNSNGTQGYQTLSYAAFKYAKAVLDKAQGYSVSSTTLTDLNYRVVQTEKVPFSTWPQWALAQVLP